MVSKLRKLGLNTSLCNWVLEFLAGRPQVVRMGQTISNTNTLSTGAPQGCVLCFTLRVSSHSSTSIIKFADDTVVLGLISNDEVPYLDEVEKRDVSFFSSLKASFMGGLVEVGGSAKYLHDTKSTNQQSRVTMYYSETTRFEQLTMTHLSKFTNPQVFDQKTATHVVTAVLYGAQAFLVFDRTLSEDENKQKIEGQLNVMVKNIPTFSIQGEGAVKMNDDEKKIAENISCTFHGDFHLEQNPTTYMEALQVYKQLPNLLKDNPQNVIPVKVWLYPLHLLDTQAARLVRDVSTSLVSKTEAVMEVLEELERRCNDLFTSTMVNVFSDIKERLSSFQSSFSTYKLVFQKALCKVLPAIRGGGEDEQSLVNILEIHKNSAFNASMQWLDDVKFELDLLSSYTKSLKVIKAVDAEGLSTILLNPDIDFVVCLTFTSLRYEDQYLSSLKEFLESDKFKKLEGNQTFHSVESDSKWFNNADVITSMRETLSLYKIFSEANKEDKKMCFIISAISDSSSPGSSIYLYEQGKLTDKRFQPVSKPPAPTVKSIQGNTVSLKLQKSQTGETAQYSVEYRPEEKEKWLITNTADEDFTLTGLESDKQYLMHYKIVGRVGVSEASDTVTLYLSKSLPVIVGGTGGGAFCFMSNSENTIQKIRITYNKVSFNTIQVTFNNGNVINVGGVPENDHAECVFDKDEKILAARLWPNVRNDRVAGLQFEIAKSNGERRTFSVKCLLLGQPVSLDVKSGRCYGIIGRSGSQIDALGFYFI
ncbi:cytolytic toxin-alpha-like [Triplophysa rosa]|uniref:cytolytic toxin-alpha-like n=1 Tax=Triplophysa rosa TaxID=992332 RepID=UPI002545CE5F|nr:cytolytic toxin-alpha-like [Triplophysa rosa]